MFELTVVKNECEECKGCKLFNQCSFKDTTDFKKDGISYSCPCKTCLLKAICNVSCKEFETYNKLCSYDVLDNHVFKIKGT